MLKIIIPFLLILFMSPGMALELNGITRYSNKFDLNLATAGVIKSIHVKAGQLVKAGDVLLEIDATAHQARLNRARALAQSLLPEVGVSELEFERAQELYDRDSISQVALQNAENKLLRAKGQHESAQAESALREYELSLTSIRAPGDGQILAVNASIGLYIDPTVKSPVLISMANTQQLSAVAKLKPEQLKHSLLNKKATIKFRGKNYNSQVSAVGLSVIDSSGKKSSYQLSAEFETPTPVVEGLPLKINVK